MSKFTCLVLCVVAASLNSIHVTKADTPTLRDNLKPILEACKKEYPAVTTDAINKAAAARDPTLVEPCFNGCVFKKAGFLNDKGEYDQKTALTNLRQIVKDEEQLKKLEEIAKECTSVKDTVSDGEAGCERGTRLSACFVQHKTNADKDFRPAFTSIEDFETVLVECATEHNVTKNDLQTATDEGDVTIINPCFWGCCLKGTGFLDDDGHYVVYPGLTYVRNIVKKDDIYNDLENIARQCESVNNEFKTNGVGALCERGALLAACFKEQTYKTQFFSKR